MMNEETKAALNEFLKKREERIKNMTLAEARDIVGKIYGHSDMRMESDKALQMLLDCADKALEQRWIPVTERLPKENGQYLITVKYKPEAGYENIYAEHGEWTDGQWDMFCFGHCGEVEDIVAWMPLPEPYKEDAE